MVLKRVREGLGENRFARRLWRLCLNLDRHDVAQAANAITFDAFLSTIPLMAMAGYVLHRVHKSGDLILALLSRTAPQPILALAGTEYLRLSEAGAVALAPISVIGFLWLSSSGISTTMGVFDRIFMARHRPWYQRRVIALGCVILGLAIAVATAFATVALATTIGSDAAPVIAIVFPTLVMIATVAGFYRIAIRRPPAIRRRSLPGALVTVVLWALVSLLFSAYVRYFAQYTTFYGSLGTVAILLLWQWLLSFALVVGGEVNADLEGVRDEEDGPASMPMPRR